MINLVHYIKNYSNLARIMRIFQLLSFKIFVLIFIILALLTFGISYFQTKSQAEHYDHLLTLCAMRTSNIIRASTRHAMMLDRSADTFEIIQSIGKQYGIIRIRIYDKNGIIKFSTDSTDLKKKTRFTSPECSVCHSQSGKAVEPITLERQKRIVMQKDGTRNLGFITPIPNEKSCYLADCHIHHKEDKVLGVLDICLSMKDTDAVLKQEKATLTTYNIIVTLLLALFVGFVIWRGVHIPMTKFLIGTKEISSGNLNYKINIKRKDEIGVFAESFNKMTEDLRKAKKEVTEWSNELEKRVEEKTEELKKTQERILQIEKMASLGKLSATVAHELNNPMAGILTYSKLIQRKLQNDELSASEKKAILKQLKMIESESDRCGKIIKDLLLFSKKQRIEIRPHSLNEIVKMAFQLVSHHLELNNIEVKKELQPNLPMVNVDENQIKQMLLALIVNAVEAMEANGVLTVSTLYKVSEKKVYLSVKDNGRGIPEEVMPHIFEPFFTTKTAVKGFGLGLSVVYGIVQNHRGEIKVDSRPNEGTTFTIKLPINLEVNREIQI